MDATTKEVLDERTRKGLTDAPTSFAEYAQREVDAYMVDRYPGIQESSLNPKSIQKIEYSNPGTRELIYKLIDPKIIGHACTKVRKCHICRKMIWTPVCQGPRNFIFTYTYRPC